LDFILQQQHIGKGSVHEIFAILDKKGLYLNALNALLGEYSGNRFLDKIKASVPFEALKLNTSKDNPILPYLVEFHLSTILSLLRLWYRRQKDVSLDEILSLILRLYTGGISAINE